MRFRDQFPMLARDLGFFPTGPRNAITDVPGVEVGHATLHDAKAEIFTGCTAIWPRRDVYSFRPRAAGHVLHGAGEMTGLHQILEWGLIETPILLTSTLNVGKVYDAVIDYFAERHPQMGLSEDVLIPVVAECDDSHLSQARLRPVGAADVRAALDGATNAAPAEGSVGAGTGMIAFDYKGGIGTASRVVPAGTTGKSFTLGALVNANLGFRRQLRLAGRLVGRELDTSSEPKRAPSGERSIIVVLATDAPMRPDQLRRVCVRASLGLARAGSFAGHGSGEIIVGFTTALGETRGAGPAIGTAESLRDDALNPFYEATAECVEEAVLNALSANSGEFHGRDGRVVPAIPVTEISRLLARR